MSRETEYFSSLPLMLLGSQMFAKEMRQGTMTFVAGAVLLFAIVFSS
jgi:hypothetical protein